MTRFALTLEFDGTPFQGLQRQKDAPSVQGTVEAALQSVVGEAVTLHSAGRTDSGVHALAMRSHVDIAKDIGPFRLMEAINAVVRPHPVAVIACEIKPDDWHSRFSCIRRRYQYRIRNRRAPLTVDLNRAWHIRPQLDHEAMQRAALYLVGHHDFTTFRSAHCQSDSPVRTLESLTVRRVADAAGDWIILDTAARSFLHHQVRSMVGCLALVGMGRWKESQIEQALAARDRHQLGLNAPAHGLYFMGADYPEEA